MAYIYDVLLILLALHLINLVAIFSWAYYRFKSIYEASDFLVREKCIGDYEYDAHCKLAVRMLCFCRRTVIAVGIISLILEISKVLLEGNAS